MSLLLDALKRAEQEKKARPEEQREARGPQLVSGGKGTLELQPKASAESPAPPHSPSSAAAQALAPAPPRKRRPVLWIAGAAVFVFILIGAGFVWYSIDQLQPRTVSRAPPLRPVAPPPPASAPAPQPEPAASPSAAPAASALPANAPAPSIAPAPRAESPATVAAPPAVLQPGRATDRPRVPAEVRDGYEALRRGELAAAKRSYAAAQANDPTNLDALLGLATVEARGGSRDAAVALYRRALEVDPRNATALAALAALADASQPEAVEARLLREIAEQPSSAALPFMLGNLYAAQGRWGQAQAAYFEAHRLEPGGADILHNLAVSLDQLGKGPMAAGFYRKALEAGRTQPAAFDPAAVTRRLAELEPAR